MTWKYLDETLGIVQPGSRSESDFEIFSIYQNTNYQDC